MTDGNLIGRSVRGAEVPFPALVLRQSALRANIARMAEFCSQHDVLIAPHAKTHMTHEIAALQVDAGAWGLSVATVEQAAVYASQDVDHLLVANEVTGRASIRALRGLHEHSRRPRVYCLVDSHQGVALLDAGFAGSAPLRVLIEYGYHGRRGGVRDLAVARGLAEAVRATANLELVGLCTYEGAVATTRDAASLEKIDDAVDALAEAAAVLEEEALFSMSQSVIVTAGGSVFFDRVAERLRGLPRPRFKVIIRSGAYATHDVGHYERLSPLPFTAATEVWADVISAPQPGLAILGAGKRDVPYDMDLPVPTGWWVDGARREPQPSWTVVDTNDHHAFMQGEAPMPSPGDVVTLGVSHPCTTFDKWRQVLVVDDDDVVTAVWPTHFS